MEDEYLDDEELEDDELEDKDVDEVSLANERETASGRKLKSNVCKRQRIETVFGSPKSNSAS